MLGWSFVLWSTMNMDAPLVQLMMPIQAAWSLQEAMLVWVMWAVMMGAMMLPSAVPMILVHRRVSARKERRDHSFSINWWFIAAYLAVWSIFSLAATTMQWGLQSAGAISSIVALHDVRFGGGVLIVTGLIQLTPFKQTCLTKCRTPISFLLTEWRPGRIGAIVMGAQHGAYCVGCCWALMMLLFVFGVMSLTAIVVLSTVVAVEKLLPYGHILGKIGGYILIFGGVWMFVS